MFDLVFYQIMARRMKIAGDLHEAAILAAITMVAPALCVVLTIDLGMAAYFHKTPLAESLNKYAYLVSVFAVLYGAHHLFFISGGRYKTIFDLHSRDQKVGIATAFFYLLLPIAGSGIFVAILL